MGYIGRRALAIAIPGLILILISPALFAKKRPAASTTPPAIPQMSGDQLILHMLNRLAFGPRSGDVEAVKREGLTKWIDEQLHPETIAENPALESKLAPLDSLRMSTLELALHYPNPGILKQMIDGKIPYPSDPEGRYVVNKLVARYERKDAADRAGQTDPDLNARAIPESWQVGEDQWQVLETGKPPEQLALLAAMPPAEQYDVLDAMQNGARQKLVNPASPAIRRKIVLFNNGPIQVVNQDLFAAKILRAVYSNRQLEEVLTDFWFNHFNVNLDKGADRYMVTGYERDVIRPHILGHFKDLLLATAQSSAMLFYLDNWQSQGPDPTGRRKQGLNENYGRELLELHTLGVDGGYTQQDVTEVARCFTGWSIDDPQKGGGFVYKDNVHDKGEKHVLGLTIPAGGGESDGLKVLDMLAHSPVTAHFISKNLAIRFVSDNPPQALVKKMAATFTRTDGDLREVMRTMIFSPEFRDPANFRSKMKSPFEMIASAARAVNAEIDFPQPLTGQLNQLGEPLYRKLEPTGYSNSGSEWTNSASLLARMNFGIALASGKIGGVKVDLKQFTPDFSPVERGILFTEPSDAASEAIQTGLSLQPQAGAMVAGLTLGSPDFQRR